MNSPLPSQESAYYTQIRPVPNPPRLTFNADRILGGTRGRGSLWQGAASTVNIADMYGFDTIILCAQEWQPSMVGARIEVIRFLSDDAPLTRAHLQEAIFISGKVERRIRAGKHVLCTCFAGLNRSGLVTALAVMKLTKKPGREVVGYIQQKRDGALCNESFAATLRLLRPR